MLLTSLAVASMLAGCEPAPTTPATVDYEPVTAPPPASNVVLICIDTVGADYFFSDNVEDGLALRMGSAQRYMNATSTAPWTIPAVASTLTGLYPLQHNAGQFQNEVANLDTDLPRSLSDSAVTLAEMLNEHQFRTGAVSAHPWFTAGFGLEQGFRQMHARRGWEKITTKFDQWLDEGIKRHTRQSQRAQNQGKPAPEPQRFFGYLHFMEAHDWHLKSPKELRARLADVDPATRGSLLKDASLDACTDENSVICKRNLVYLLAVRELRNAVNKVLASLEERDLLNDTLVMVYSDHGEEFWEHKAQHEQRGDPRDVRGFGHGHSMYQELLHVPLAAWHPHAEGAAHDDLVSLLDVVPSILGWLDVEQPGGPLPGRLMPTGTQSLGPEPRVLFASGIAYGPEAIAVREGHMKSILDFPDENFQFFNLEKDPGEHRPLKDDSLVLRFDALTGDYVEMENQSLASGTGPEMDSETLEHLKSIGYLQGVEEQPEQAKMPVNKQIEQQDLDPQTSDKEETP